MTEPALPPLPYALSFDRLASAPGPAYSEDQMRKYAATAVRAAILAEREAIKAEMEELRQNGPPMARGRRGDGSVKMGTMRDCLNDYKRAAETEARLGDEARAELAAIRARK